jgi:protein-S-isoprenylcysteine O-methyltransferase Ste14
MVQKGIFGTGLADAISDVPEARDHALSWRSRNIAGLTTQLVGLAMVIPGVAVIEPSAGMSTRNIISVSLVSGGLAAAIIGTAVALSGQSRLWDAFNVYNDKVAERRAQIGPGGLSFRW